MLSIVAYKMWNNVITWITPEHITLLDKNKDFPDMVKLKILRR
jgi:hypothetical protein